MMRPLSRREARLVALLIFVVALVLVHLVVIAPLWAGFADRAAQRQVLTRQIQANGRMVAAIPRLRRLAEARKAMGSDYTLSAPDSAAAGEALRARLQSAVLAAGGEFLSGEDITAPANTAAVRISLRLGWLPLLQLTQGLENSRPYLTISSLAIGADDALVTGQATKLDVQIEASIPFKPAAAR